MNIRPFTMLAAIILPFSLLPGCGGGSGATPAVSSCSQAVCLQSAASDKVIGFIHTDTISFSAVAIGADAAQANVEWNFGDGITDEGLSVSHAYATPGVYVVSAKVTSPAHPNVQDQKLLVVRALRPETVILDAQDHVMAIDSNGYLLRTAANYSTALGSGPAANFPVNQKNLYGQAEQIEPWSLANCEQGNDCGQTFMILKNSGALYATGNSNNSALASSPRSTGVASNATPYYFSASLQQSGEQLQDIKKVSAFLSRRAFALRGDGAVFAVTSLAANNSSGELGIGSKNSTTTNMWFERVIDNAGRPITGAIDVIAGGGKTYLLKADGTVWAAGSNNRGVSGGLGIGNQDSNDYPSFNQARLSDGSPLTQVKSIAVSQGGSVYAVRFNGELWAAGSNTYGQLGVGEAVSPSDSGRAFYRALDVNNLPLTNVRDVFVPKGANDSAAFVVLNNGDLLAAGLNVCDALCGSLHGQIGVQTTFESADGSGKVYRFAAVINVNGSTVGNVVSVSAVAGGASYALVLLDNGVVRAVGNSYGGGSGRTASNDPASGVSWSGVTMNVRYADWTDRSNLTGYHFVDQASQPMTKVVAGYGTSVILGQNGEMYIASGTPYVNRILNGTAQAFTSVDPVQGGSRFKSGL